MRGAINVVLRNSLDGFATRSLTRMPSQEGGDGWQGSAFWGGSFGKGRITVGVDASRRQEIPASSREHSRSVWQPRGSFSEARNVSIGGNTVWVYQVDEGQITGLRTGALGDCHPADGYTGPLTNPPGSTHDGDRGCGFAYGGIMWNTTRFAQNTTIVDLEHPIDDENRLHLSANLGQGDWTYRFAPSVGGFSFRPNQRIIDAINSKAGETIVDNDDIVVVAHRFVGHGNRDWRTDWHEYDVSMGIEGRFTTDLGYDAHFAAYRLDGSLSGSTFVHVDRLREEVEAGRYDLVDPFSNEPEHLQAIANSSLEEEIDFGSTYLGTRLALEGRTFAPGDRRTAWTVGVEANRSKRHSVLRFRDDNGETHPVTDVLGSGGVSYGGERKAVGVFADVLVPLAETLDIRVAGRGADYDDVGTLRAWNLAAEYRPHEVLALRSSLRMGQRAPSMSQLYSTEDQDHPYITCDPGRGDPPRTCTSPNPRQVARFTTGNPQLEPYGTERFSAGAELRKNPHFVGVEWYRLSRSDLTARNSADWAMQNLPECGEGENSHCISRTGGITIYDAFANVEETEISGIETRYGAAFPMDWGEIGMSGAWRHVISAERYIAGNKDRYAISRNMARGRFMARHGNLTGVWTVNYRAAFKNEQGTGTFGSWTGHDAVLDWKDPMGLQGARVAAGVFNLTNASLTVDTANPSSVDGPTAAGWDRTLFLTLNARF
ncbi:MAG: TonB-dependent receptor [bacterium]|nr:TonB-dependent receptor [bacterium]MDE0242179.1 TonB-dependent receptor [bacterium]MDE0416719.1 TonB-dependent receptor [bacterium]